MIITGLELRNFRNYGHQEIQFSPERNVVTGRNAQGKSNLLEAVYFLSHLKSIRTPRMRDLVTEGQQKASVKGDIIDGELRLSVRVSFSEEGKKVEVNGQRAESAARVRGLVKCVLFSPEDLYLVKGEPSRRREFLDETVEGLGPAASSAFAQYRHVLRQRNAVLRSWEDHGGALGTVIEPWDEALVRAGARIVMLRTKMISEMQGYAADVYRQISGDSKELRLVYSCTFDPGAGGVEEAEQGMREALLRSSMEEKRARTTVIGPHRDDVEISVGGRAARFSASQGEQRSIAFCKRVAQRKYLESETGKEPIMLLDDVLSELDEGRRRRVLKLAGAGSQSVITTTELPEGPQTAGEKIFMVEKGEVRVV